MTWGRLVRVSTSGQGLVNAILYVIVLAMGIGAGRW